MSKRSLHPPQLPTNHPKRYKSIPSLSYLQTIPHDIQFHLLSHILSQCHRGCSHCHQLDTSNTQTRLYDLLSLALTCRSFYNLVSSQLTSDTLWKHLAPKHSDLQLLYIHSMHSAHPGLDLKHSWYLLAGKNLKQADLTNLSDEQTSFLLDAMIQHPPQLQTLIIKNIKLEIDGIGPIVHTIQKLLQHSSMTLTKLTIPANPTVIKDCVLSTNLKRIKSFTYHQTKHHIHHVINLNKILNHLKEIGACLNHIAFRFPTKLGIFYLPLCELAPTVKNLELLYHPYDSNPLAQAPKQQVSKMFTNIKHLSLDAYHPTRLLGYLSDSKLAPNLKTIHTVSRHSREEFQQIDTESFQQFGTKITSFQLENIRKKKPIQGPDMFAFTVHCTHLQTLIIRTQLSLEAVHFLSDYIETTPHLRNLTIECTIDERLNHIRYSTDLEWEECSKALTRAITESKSNLRHLCQTKYFLNRCSVMNIILKHGATLRCLQVICVSTPLSRRINAHSLTISPENAISLLWYMRKHCPNLENFDLGLYANSHLICEHNRIIESPPLEVQQAIVKTINHIPTLEDKSLEWA